MSSSSFHNFSVFFFLGFSAGRRLGMPEPKENESGRSPTEETGMRKNKSHKTKFPVRERLVCEFFFQKFLSELNLWPVEFWRAKHMPSSYALPAKSSRLKALIFRLERSSTFLLLLHGLRFSFLGEKKTYSGRRRTKKKIMV